MMDRKIVKLLKQMIQFGIIGGLAFVIDYAILYICTDLIGIYYLVSSVISFTVAVLFNYVCSMKYVFKGKEDMSKQKELFIFIILSVIGLVINSVTMKSMVDLVGINYLIAKIFATGIVMVWNFVTRKIFLEHKNSDDLHVAD